MERTSCHSFVKTFWTRKNILRGQFTTDMEKIETSKLENRSMITIGG